MPLLNRPGTAMAIRLAIVFALVWIPSRGWADTIHLSPESSWFETVNGDGLKPGDEVILKGGVYQDARRLSVRHRGTIDEPILVRSAEGQTAIFQRPDAKQNTFNLEGAVHIQLVNLEVTGGAAGIRIGPSSSPTSGEEVAGIQVRGCHLHHLGGVAITCNAPGATYRQCQFVANHIHHTSGHGEAFYLGGNNATATFHDGLIERNYIHHLNGPSVSQGDGIEIKDGSSGNRIVANVIHDTNYPGITVYGSGNGPVNRIVRNVIWNTGDHGIQAAADAVIDHNTIANPKHSGIYSRKHQGASPGRLLITHNVIVRSGQSSLRVIHDREIKEQFPVKISYNQFHRENAGDEAVRIDASMVIAADHNRGIGKWSAPVPIHHGFNTDEHWGTDHEIKWTIPRDDDHPAWKWIDRLTLWKRLGRQEGQ